MGRFVEIVRGAAGRPISPFIILEIYNEAGGEADGCYRRNRKTEVDSECLG
jgi:hypothetical protein